MQHFRQSELVSWPFLGSRYYSLFHQRKPVIELYTAVHEKPTADKMNKILHFLYLWWAPSFSLTYSSHVIWKWNWGIRCWGKTSSVGLQHRDARIQHISSYCLFDLQIHLSAYLNRRKKLHEDGWWRSPGGFFLHHTQKAVIFAEKGISYFHNAG